MKRLYLCLLAIILLRSSALASTVTYDDGQYVPGFQSFMNVFYNEVVQIDDDLAEELLEKCHPEETWTDTNDRDVYSRYDETKVQIDEAYGFLSEIMFTLRSEEFHKNEQTFKVLIIAATKAVLPDHPDSFYDSIFDNIKYQYTVDSPASSISMYTNFGVFQFGLHKTSYSTYLRISLSLYEH